MFCYFTCKKRCPFMANVLQTGMQTNIKQKIISATETWVIFAQSFLSSFVRMANKFLFIRTRYLLFWSCFCWVWSMPCRNTRHFACVQNILLSIHKHSSFFCQSLQTHVSRIQEQSLRLYKRERGREREQTRKRMVEESGRKKESNGKKQAKNALN